jgi:hypothetical protein
MKRLVRLTALVLLIAASLSLTPGEPLAAQGSGETETEAPETFVPTEELPAGSAVSFPIDI